MNHLPEVATQLLGSYSNSLPTCCLSIIHLLLNRAPLNNYRQRKELGIAQTSIFVLAGGGLFSRRSRKPPLGSTVLGFSHRCNSPWRLRFGGWSSPRGTASDNISELHLTSSTLTLRSKKVDSLGWVGVGGWGLANKTEISILFYCAPL